MLKLVGYDDNQRVLEVVFNTGDRYRYLEVPASAYEGLMSAESIGQYMHRYVIDHLRLRAGQLATPGAPLN